MKIWCSLLLMAFPQAILGIGYYQPGDTLHVWAASGLQLRESPSMSAKSLGTIPYGTALVAENFRGDRAVRVQAVPPCPGAGSTNPAVYLDGDFAQVTFQGKRGYVFDGYLSTLPARIRYQRSGHADDYELLDAWATRCFGLVQQQIEKRSDADHRLQRLYSNGMIMKRVADKGSHGYTIFHSFSMEELFLLLNQETSYEKRVRENDTMNVPIFVNISPREWHFNGSGCSYKLIHIPELNIGILYDFCSC